MRLLVLCIALLLPSACANFGTTGASKPKATADDIWASVPVCTARHVGFFGSIVTLTDEQGLFYRTGSGPWQTAALDLDDVHSVARLPNGRWLINDTNNHRLIETDALDGTGETVIVSEVDGLALHRPHDQVVDPDAGFVYVIDGTRRLLRFRTLDGPIEAWQFAVPEEMDYARALSWFDGALHIVHSSRGQVLRIDDFAARRYTVFTSPRPRGGPVMSDTLYRDFPAGALSTTGLVLNDVEKLGDWYYGTNLFAEEYAAGGDPRPARLIRWRTWDEFEQGTWEDLSEHLPGPDAIPYYLSVHEGALYVALADNNAPPCPSGPVIRLEQ